MISGGFESSISSHDFYFLGDDTYQMDMAVHYSDVKSQRKSDVSMNLHQTFLDHDRRDLFMHPIMEFLTQFKWWTCRKVFWNRLWLDLFLCLAFSAVGYLFVGLYDCKFVDETDEKTGHDKAQEGICNHMNDHFSVAEHCYYFFEQSSFIRGFDSRTYFVNRWYGCDGKSRIVTSTITNPNWDSSTNSTVDNSEFAYPNGTELPIQCYKNNTLRYVLKSISLWNYIII